MKKVGILFILLNVLSFSAVSAKSTKTTTTQSVIGRFNQLEAEYERLLNMEQQEYDKLKATADAATNKLAEKEAQKAQLQERISKVEAAGEAKAFKAEYAELAKKYKSVVKALDNEIKSLKATIDNFTAIETLKSN
ncbi:adhesion protein FadA [Leptotrichia sp. HSP-342]|uniref:Adhesion protein FadA n=1 Tax=Leptotrichia mesophila TaxID=3239303 RepID=A0AB39VB20_9FUSO